MLIYDIKTKGEKRRSREQETFEIYTIFCITGSCLAK